MTGLDGIRSLEQTLGTAGVNEGRKAPQTPQAQAAPSDQARVSPAATLASADSDVRLDKVAALRSAIAAGSYSVPAGAVADKLIGSLLK